MSVFMETCDFEAFVQQWAFASCEEASHSSLVRCSISRRNYFIDQPLAEYLLTRPSKCRLRLFVPTQNYAIGVHDDDCIERAIPVEGSEGRAYLAAGARRTFLTRPTRKSQPYAVGAGFFCAVTCTLLRLLAHPDLTLLHDRGLPEYNAVAFWGQTR